MILYCYYLQIYDKIFVKYKRGIKGNEFKKIFGFRCQS